MTGIDHSLFKEDHYLGKPADTTDKIISRRINILSNYPEFFGTDLSLIEVGCGSGATINKLAHAFDHCIGVDVFDYSKQFEQLKNSLHAVNAEFRLLNLEEQLPAEKFDRLISFEVIEHLKSEKSVANFNEVLKPGGIAAITVPNKWWIFETHGARLPLLPWNRVPFFSWLPRPIHERLANARIYTANRILSLLKTNGFDIIEWCYITAPMDVLKEGKLKRWLVKNIFRFDITTNPFLSTSIFVIARKKHAS